jgi:hypothetical protein
MTDGAPYRTCDVPAWLLGYPWITGKPEVPET